MKSIYKIVAITLITVMIFGTVNVVYADRTLTDKENAAFIKRPEWQEWVAAFTASLSEIDSKSTEQIFEDMDFYDMQYKFTSAYKIADGEDRTTAHAEKGYPNGMTQEEIDDYVIQEKIRRGLM